MKLKKLIKQLLKILPQPEHPSFRGQPGNFLRWRYGWLKGWYIRSFYAIRTLLIGQKITIGKRFSCDGRLRIRGRGMVIIGDDAIVSGTTDIFTTVPESCVIIGRAVFLNGTRFSSVQNVSVGEYCILADCRITDSDFHSISKRRLQPGIPVPCAPVRVEENVWLAAQTAVLKGVTIGRDSVISFGSVVTKSVPAGTIVAGVPAKVIGEVPE